MDRNLSDRIRERAYEIWVSSGCRDGEAEQHWFTAEQEILASCSLHATRASPPAAAIKDRAKPKRSKASTN
jgi:Protein of unknown function (DUF2934)